MYLQTIANYSVADVDSTKLRTKNKNQEFTKVFETKSSTDQEKSHKGIKI